MAYLLTQVDVVRIVRVEFAIDCVDIVVSGQ